MNRDYDDLRRQVLAVLRTVEPKDDETISHAIMGLVISMDVGKIYRASEREPRIRVPNADRTDGWRERVHHNFNSANDEKGR